MPRHELVYTRMVDPLVYGADAATDVAARGWLAKTAAECEHWAYRFTWRYFTLGLHSTQRIEAVHLAIAHFLRASTLLTNLLPQLESYSLDVSVRVSVREYRFIERLLALRQPLHAASVHYCAGDAPHRLRARSL